MVFAQHTAQATVGEIDLNPSEVRVELNDRWSPYGRADVTIPMPAAATLDLVDPRAGARVTVALGKDQPAQARTFDLGVRERHMDHNRKTVTLALATDEALLQDKRRVSTVADTSSVDDAAGGVYAPAASLATFVNRRVLPELQPANLTRNPVPNTTWGVSSALTRFYFAHADDGHYILGRRTATGNAYIYLARFDADYLTPGEQYTYAFDVKPDNTATITPRITSHNEAGSEVSFSYATGTGQSCPADVWTRVAITFTAPASGRASASFLWPTGSVDQSVRARHATLVAGDVALDWSAPELTTIAADHDFSATPEVLVWEPGIDAWSLLEPLFQTAGVRLYCDEARAWHLVSAEHTVPGLIQISEGENVTRAGDTISRRSDAWYDSVVIAYTGADPVQYDIAGSPGTRTLRLSYDRPYPGPGAAAKVLRRAGGRGRVLELSAVSNYGATPGKALVANLPETPAQTGYITGIQWRAPDDEMTIASRGLIDTPAAAWAFLPAGESWADSPIGESWADETV